MFGRTSAHSSSQFRNAWMIHVPLTSSSCPCKAADNLKSPAMFGNFRSAVYKSSLSQANDCVELRCPRRLSSHDAQCKCPASERLDNHSLKLRYAQEYRSAAPGTSRGLAGRPTHVIHVTTTRRKVTRGITKALIKCYSSTWTCPYSQTLCLNL
jgi:hypothetical protein